MTFTVVHVLNGLRFGGNESLCLQLLRHAPPGVRSVLVNIDPSRTEMSGLFSEIPALEVMNVAYKSGDKTGFVLRLATALERVEPAAMLTYPFGQHTLTSVAGRIAGCRRLGVHAGNPPPPEGDPRRRIWSAIVATSVVVDSPIWFCSLSVERAFKTLGVPLPPRSKTIWNGTDVKQIAERAAASAGVHERPVVGMIARLNEIKDQATLVRAIALVRDSGTEVELWLVGDGEQRPALEALARELKVDDSVRFWGERSDVPELLGQMDIFAFSTTADEGFGIAIIEAMASRRPVVATDVPACREVLGSDGVLVPAKDPAAMAEALKKLLASSQQRRALGQKLHDRAMRLYDAASCARAYYDELMG